MGLEMGRRRWGMLAGTMIAVLALSACGSAAESESSDGQTAATAASDTTTSEPADSTDSEPVAEADVTVVLGEWVVDPQPTSIAAGAVDFLADNGGGLAHELVVTRADDPADLPTDEDGAVDESQIPEGDFIGEIEEFPSGEQRTGTFDLEAGTYVLFCNVTETEDDGDVQSHFAEGMSTVFTVQ